MVGSFFKCACQISNAWIWKAFFLNMQWYFLHCSCSSGRSNKNIRLGFEGRAGIQKSVAAGFDPVESMMLLSPIPDALAFDTELHKSRFTRIRNEILRFYFVLSIKYFFQNFVSGSNLRGKTRKKVLQKCLIYRKEVKNQQLKHTTSYTLGFCVFHLLSFMYPNS